MENKEKFVKSFLAGRNNRWMLVDKNKISTFLGEVVDKLSSNQQLDELDKSFLNSYMTDYYPTLGGDLAYYPRYDEKLTDAHKKLAAYYIQHPESLDKDNVRFIVYYVVTLFCKEFNLKTYVAIRDKKTFETTPGAAAVHTNDVEKGTSQLTFNPKYFDYYIQSKNVYRIIDICVHELEHEVQHREMKNVNITDPQAIIWAKEELTRKVIGELYYKNNYYEEFIERDARFVAYNKTKEIVESHGGVFKDYRDGILHGRDDSYKREIIHEQVETGETLSALDIFDAVANEYIKKYPAFRNNYPVLKNIYDEKGNKKNIVQIEHELSVKKQEEIDKNPDKEREIEAKYSKLLYGIAKTDNDLFIQYLCLEADYLAELNDEIGLKSKVNLINKIMKDRDMSFEELRGRINNRIKELEKISFKDSKNTYLREELNSSRKLINCLLKYNEEFKKQHDQKQIEDKYKREIERITGIEITDKNYVIGSKEDLNGSVLLEDKTKEELKNEFIKQKMALEEANLDKEMYDEYMNFLESSYDEFNKSRFAEDILAKNEEEQEKVTR